MFFQYILCFGLQFCSLDGLSLDFERMEMVLVFVVCERSYRFIVQSKDL